MPGHSFGDAPDGGWGWVVCAAGFVAMTLLDGLMFSFGVLFVELVVYFDESRGKVALVGSLMVGMSLFFGPVTSAMVHILGFRWVTFLGALVIAAALILTTFVSTVNWMIFTYGVLGGVGICMCYISSMLAVSIHFSDKRAIANGIMMSGSGIGTFIYAPLCSFLLYTYGWRGTLLVIAAISLNCAACGACFRPLIAKETRNICNSRTDDADHDADHDDEYKKDSSHVNPPDDTQTTFLYDSFHGSRMLAVPQRVLSEAKENFGSLTSCNSVSIPLSHKLRLELEHRLAPAGSCTESLLFGQNDARHITLNGCQHRSTELKPLQRKDIFYSGSLARLAKVEATKHNQATPTNQTAVEDNTETGSSPLQQLLGICKCQLLCDPAFLLMILLSCLWSMHYSLLTLLPSFVQDAGFSSHEASFVVSAMGVANILGRGFSGFLVNKTRLTSFGLNSIALFCGSLVTMTFCWTSQFVLLVVEGALFGLCQGAWISLRPILLVDLLGVENLTNSLGWLVMFQGIAFTLGPPLVAELCDVSHSYHVPLLIIALSFLASGICSVLINIILNKRHNSANKL